MKLTTLLLALAIVIVAPIQSPAQWGGQQQMQQRTITPWQGAAQPQYSQQQRMVPTQQQAFPQYQQQQRMAPTQQQAFPQYQQQQQAMPATNPQYQPQQSASGKKWLQHESGYRVLVDRSVVPAPGFTEIPMSGSQMMTPQQGGAQQFGQMPQGGTGNMPPQLQQDLPYQPPAAPIASQPGQYQGGYGQGYSQQGQSYGGMQAPKKVFRHKTEGYQVTVDAHVQPGPMFEEVTGQVSAPRPMPAQAQQGAGYRPGQVQPGGAYQQQYTPAQQQQRGYPNQQMQQQQRYSQQQMQMQQQQARPQQQQFNLPFLSNLFGGGR